jgi:Bacterial protein of unknown function (DUF945).
MNATQKVIKYLAIAFALFLAFTIITTIAGVIFGIVNRIPGTHSGNSSTSSQTIQSGSKNLKNFSGVYENVDSISIDSHVYSLNVVQGTNYSVTCKNVSKYYKVDFHNGKLDLKYDRPGFSSNGDIGFGWLSWLTGKTTNLSNSGIVTVTIPANAKLDKFVVDAGVGSVNLNNINAEYLKINAGTGSINGQMLQSDKTRIDSGTGNITLSDVTFSDSQLDCGTGNVTINGSLNGESKLDGGIGNIRLSLKGSSKDYDIEADNGIGNITINGKDYHNFESNNDAENSLDIDGGVGNVTVDFEQ